MSVRTIQYLLALVFFVLGGWCLVAPESVLELAITPQYRSDAPIVPILMAAFGAQAVIAGTFAAFTRFTRTTSSPMRPYCCRSLSSTTGSISWSRC